MTNPTPHTSAEAGGPAHHPFRDLAIHAFAGVGVAQGRAVARFYPYGSVPMTFTGSSVGDVIAKAEAFRAEAIAKHEATFIARSEALAKARAVRHAKEPRP